MALDGYRDFSGGLVDDGLSATAYVAAPDSPHAAVARSTLTALVAPAAGT